eukprot:5686268-Amphidinium_carterae.1
MAAVVAAMHLYINCQAVINGTERGPHSNSRNVASRRTFGKDFGPLRKMCGSTSFRSKHTAAAHTKEPAGDWWLWKGNEEADKWAKQVLRQGELSMFKKVVGVDQVPSARGAR